MRFALALALVFMPALASAAPAPTPAFEVIDRGDVVEVVAHNVKATHTVITPVRSRLEIPVATIAYVPTQAPKDATLKEIGFDNQSLSVKLNFERADVKTLAKYAQATQVGEDLHLIVPRKVPADGEIVKIPEPTLPPALAAKLAEAEKATAKIETPKVEPAKVEPKIEAKPIAMTDLPVAPKPPKKAIPTVTEDDGWSKVSMYAAAGLGAIGLGVWLLKRKKSLAVPVATIDVIAQRSLGGKARIMWLAAGTREMVIAVTPQSIRMLGQWKRGANNNDIQQPLPEAQTMERTVSGRLAFPRAPVSADDAMFMPRAATSPAVSGLIRLRAQTAVSHEVATDDIEADAQWAKDLLAATGARR